MNDRLPLSLHKCVTDAQPRIQDHKKQQSQKILKTAVHCPLRAWTSHCLRGGWGGLLHAADNHGDVSGGMFAWRATFLLTIPTSAPDLPAHGEAPQVDHIALHTFPTKHVA